MKLNAIKASLMVGVAATGVTFSVPALAQDEAATFEENAIVVTARRVEENLQDVPISITVFNQEELTKRNIAVATDLATYTPSLSVNQRYGPEKASFSIRGFNQDQSTAPTVGVYFAEVVGVRAQGGTTSGNTVGAGAFTDLENVQVLKGPQGTLFGRNTTGGAILLTPRKPTADLEGYVEGTYGNYDQIRVQGALNVPLSDTFKVRVAAERNKRDGYMRNLSGIGPDAFNDVNYTYARLSLLAELTPDLENYTIFHYSNSETNGYASRNVGCADPATATGLRALLGAACSVQLARQTARGDSLYEIETNNPIAFLDIETWQFINTTTWQASDTLTVKNIVSYGEFRERANFDLQTSNFLVPGAPIDIPLQTIVLDTAGPNQHNAAQSTFTEELQFQWESADGSLNAVLGGYLEFARPIGFNAGRTSLFLYCERPQNLSCINPLRFGSISESSTKFNFDNHGIFAQATYNITDQLALTGGIRYTFDKIEGLTNSTRAVIVPAGTPGSFVDPISGVSIVRACTDSFRHAGETPGLDRSVCETRLVESSNEPTWLINLDYKPTPDLLLYAKYARGYRQGGLNFTNPGFERWAPEKLDAYEIGAKFTWRGDVSGYFNVAGFYNDLTDQQVFAALISGTPLVAGGAGIVNAGQSRSYGAEVDTSVLLFDSLRLSLAYTYLDTEVKDVADPATVGDGSELGQLLVGTPFVQIIPRVQEGSPFNLAPKHKLAANAQYTLPLDASIGEISLGATFVYESSSINDGAVPEFINGVAVGRTPKHHLLNLNLDWDSVAGSPFDLSLFATNVTKEVYTVTNGGSINSFGIADIQLNQPRFYGVRVRYNFGM